VFFFLRDDRKIQENHDRQVRRALRMHEFGYSNIEIADAMGINESDVRDLLQERIKEAHELDSAS
jgi:DNA-directed RNA polymerase specialized sigma24 family protein